jgi:hypothetical protein
MIICLNLSNFVNFVEYVFGRLGHVAHMKNNMIIHLNTDNIIYAYFYKGCTLCKYNDRGGCPRFFHGRSRCYAKFLIINKETNEN